MPSGYRFGGCFVPSAPSQAPQKILFQFDPGGSRASAPGVGHDIELLDARAVPMKSIQLSQPSLTARSNHCAPDFPRRRHTVTAAVIFRLHHEEHNKPAHDPLPACVQPLEIGSFSEPKSSWKIQARFRRQSACDPCDGGCSRSYGRFWYACEPGSHGSFCACDYWAERFFSWSSLSPK